MKSVHHDGWRRLSLANFTFFTCRAAYHANEVKPSQTRPDESFQLEMGELTKENKTEPGNRQVLSILNRSRSNQNCYGFLRLTENP